MQTQNLTDSEKQEQEKDLLYLFAALAVGLLVIEVVIIGLFIGSDHSLVAWAATIFFGATVWCLLVIVAGCARQAWRNLAGFRL